MCRAVEVVVVVGEEVEDVYREVVEEVEYLEERPCLLGWGEGGAEVLRSLAQDRWAGLVWPLHYGHH